MPNITIPKLEPTKVRCNRLAVHRIFLTLYFFA